MSSQILGSNKSGSPTKYQNQIPHSKLKRTPTDGIKQCFIEHLLKRLYSVSNKYKCWLFVRTGSVFVPSNYASYQNTESSASKLPFLLLCLPTLL